MFEVKPNLTKLNESENYAEFVVEPLPGGYGVTLGHSLRRVLLTSLEGSAITRIKIDGVQHEFTTLPGVKEDIVDLVLNIKKIRILIEGKEQATITLEKKGVGDVTAGDIKCPTGVKILNPDQYLTSLADSKTVLKIEFTVEKGKGYVSADEQEVDELNVIPIDAIFTPVLDVEYHVSDTRVGGETNFDKLQLMITTTGELAPQEALEKSSEILKSYYTFIVDPDTAEDMVVEQDEEGTHEQEEILIEELNLPMRVINSLNSAGIKTITELVEKDSKEVAKIKNLGAKSIKEIKAKLAEMNLGLKGEAEEN